MIGVVAPQREKLHPKLCSLPSMPIHTWDKYLCVIIKVLLVIRQKEIFPLVESERVIGYIFERTKTHIDNVDKCIVNKGVIRE